MAPLEPAPASLHPQKPFRLGKLMDSIAIIDFETTGLYPSWGDRAIEVAVIIVEDGKLGKRYQSLMNPGVTISEFIESFTGISNAMLRKAPSVTDVMAELASFVGTTPLVAHNASFDSKFLDAEWSRIGYTRSQNFSCSMLLARRLYPDAPNHKLGTLVDYLQLPSAKRHHRALADAEMTAYLWLKMLSDIKDRYNIATAKHDFMCALQKVPKAKLDWHIAQLKLRGPL